MGLFDLFRKPPTIQDDFFGTLTLMTFKDRTKDYFEGRGKFKPTGNEIEYFIVADLTGPTEKQRSFYQKIEDSYEELVSKFRPLIEEEFRNWKDDFIIMDFEKEFKLVSLTIPRLHSDTLTWNISFETIHDENHDENHMITVDFKNFDPDGIVIDG